ncbi:MAG: methyl-accepting chemotaxis protein [Chthoniobacteraceae bacterium]|nr:methyl-accepting chemotaxis protein [Chthoniobacteraceae bacterium]
MKHWTAQKVVSFGFAFVILVSAAICIFMFFRLGSIESRATDVQENHVPGMYITGQILQHTLQNDNMVLSYVHSTDVAQKARFKEAMETNSKENSAFMEQRGALVVKDSAEDGAFKKANERRKEYLGLRDEMMRMDADGKSQQTLAYYEEKVAPALKLYIDALNEMQSSDHSEAKNSLADIPKAVRDTKWVVFGGSFVSLLLCIGAAVAVVRMLGTTLESLMLSLIQVNGSATEMAATLKEQQASANEVASTSVEIGATAKEISATTKELGKTMSDVAGVSEQTAELATGGQAGLSRLEGTMRQIMGATASISGKLAILNEKTANINSMVTTINKVADQTNLLSLNAAIEAEKAGEYGQGFAVVATEIRRLADQTAVATYDIEQMVKEMQSAVSAGVMGMDKFAEEVRRGNEEVCGVTAQLAQIIQQVQALTPRFESVNEGMQMQSTAAGQISDALTQLGDTAQQSAQALRQNGEAIEQLMKAAQGLQTAASQLKSKDA